MALKDLMDLLDENETAMGGYTEGGSPRIPTGGLVPDGQLWVP